MKFTLGDLMGLETAANSKVDRRHFIGGSDARIIMSPNEAALIRLWEGETPRGRTRRSLGQSHRPARPRHRTPQPDLVRAQHRTQRH